MDIAFATAAGSPDRPNEDWIGATTDTVVVLDGLTTPDGLETGCRHGTVWFVHQLGAWLLGLASTEHDTSLRAHLGASIANVANTHADTCDVTHPGSPGATVAMLRARGDQIEWLVLSDAFVVLDTDDGVQVHTDDRLEQVAVEERAAMHRADLGTTEHDAARRSLVVAQRQVRNTPAGYWIASSNPDAAEHALVGAVDRGQVARAAVLTDGAAALATYGLTTWHQYLTDLEELGPAGMLTRVRKAEAGDSSGQCWPRFKRSDDASVAVYRIRT